MFREAARRLILATALAAGGIATAAIGFVVILFGRRTYADAVGSALSRGFNAATGGDERGTFSAWSALLAERGKADGAARVALVDSLPLNSPGHCAMALASHRARGLLPQA